MGEYAGDIDDYDGYEDYEDEEEEGLEDEGQGEYEEEEEKKPTAEELEYLELRARLKEQIRKKMQREHSSSGSRSLEKKKKILSDNYGSFFGPSQPVISHRVIQESKSLLENKHLALSMLNSRHGVCITEPLFALLLLHIHGDKKSSSSTPTASKNGVRGQQPKQKVKVQKLKDTRDYSFLLSDDAELPAPAKKPAPQSVSTPNSEARSAPLQQKSRLLPGSKGGNSHGDRVERKSVSVNGHMNSKVSSYKSPTGSKPNPGPVNSRMLLGSNGGSGPGRSSDPKSITSKTVGNMEKKAPVQGSRNILPAACKPPPSKVQPSVSKQHHEQRKGMHQEQRREMLQEQRRGMHQEQRRGMHQEQRREMHQEQRREMHQEQRRGMHQEQGRVVHQEQRRGIQEHSKAKVIPKQLATSSKPQINRPVKHISSRTSLQDNRARKKPVRELSDDEDEKALSMIRRMFKFQDLPDDDSDMEANYEDIMREERRRRRGTKGADEKTGEETKAQPTMT
ncbi:hypothetical protein Tsubulata_000540, partial [Turnera subulata]